MLERRDAIFAYFDPSSNFRPHIGHPDKEIRDSR
jgi:hypothetical protein